MSRIKQVLRGMETQEARDRAFAEAFEAMRKALQQGATDADAVIENVGAWRFSRAIGELDAWRDNARAALALADKVRP